MATNKLIDLSRLSRFWDKVKNYIDTNDNAIVDKIYPVGSIYMSVTDSTAAAVEARFGGTWVVFGSGKTLVGVNTSETEFNTVEKTGGNKSINLQHNHTVDKHTHYMEAYTSGNNGNTGGCTLTTNQIPSHYHVQTLGTHQAVVGGGSYHTSTQVAGEYSTTVANATAYQQITLSTGGGQSHSHGLNNHTHKIEAYTNPSGPSTDNRLSTAQNILTPYITVYMYKRTA